jgi:hypothetical protein
MDGEKEVNTNGEWKLGKAAPINSKLGLYFPMDQSKNVRLLKDLAPFALPPFSWISISHASKAVMEVEHFLYHCLGHPKRLILNHSSDLLDGSEWTEAIVKALLKVKEKVDLCNFIFSKEQVEAIVDNSLHLEELYIKQCKLRKWCDLKCGVLV